jgi:hypothetical protein
LLTPATQCLIGTWHRVRPGRAEVKDISSTNQDGICLPPLPRGIKRRSPSLCFGFLPHTSLTTVTRHRICSQTHSHITHTAHSPNDTHAIMGSIHDAKDASIPLGTFQSMLLHEHFPLLNPFPQLPPALWGTLCTPSHLTSSLHFAKHSVTCPRSHKKRVPSEPVLEPEPPGDTESSCSKEHPNIHSASQPVCLFSQQTFITPQAGCLVLGTQP